LAPLFLDIITLYSIKMERFRSIQMKLFIHLLLIYPILITAQNKALSDAAIEKTNNFVVYTPDYVGLSYPNGDVPEGNDICTAVII